MDRRQALALAAALAAAPLAGLAQEGRRLAPTPECRGEAPTPPQTEGPFYTPSTPRKSNFLADAKGERVVLEGRVLDTRCRPLAGAIVDLWHADAAGAYDNSGFRLRGHLLADAGGRYRFETIVPGYYPGRTRHFHVKVGAPGQRRVLTTQLYFPGEPGNERDGLYRRELLLALERPAAIARFDFVLRA